MSFEYAPVTKGLMMAIGITTLSAGIFDCKQYFHLQLVPHISQYYQYWRLFVHHAAYANTSDLFVAELLFLNAGTIVERRLGSLKYASFLVLSLLISTTLEFLVLLAFHAYGVNIIHAGPAALLFSILYQYSRLVPSSYDVRVLGLVFTDKAFTYALAIQIVLSRGWPTIAVAAIGLLSGQLYRSDMADLKRYRLPRGLAAFSERHLLPLVGSLRAVPRTLQAMPELRSRSTRPAVPTAGVASEADREPITTARTAAVPPAGRRSGRSVMAEWVDELTGRGQTTAVGSRAPSDAEVNQVTGMFPDLEREAVVAALQRSDNMEAAIETLLSSRT